MCIPHIGGLNKCQLVNGYAANLRQGKAHAPVHYFLLTGCHMVLCGRMFVGALQMVGQQTSCTNFKTPALVGLSIWKIKAGLLLVVSSNFHLHGVALARQQPRLTSRVAHLTIVLLVSATQCVRRSMVAHMLWGTCRAKLFIVIARATGKVVKS